jgi:hypothetical protein
MAVHSWRELPRTATHKIGESPVFERRFVLTLDGTDTSATDLILAAQCDFGTAHPECAFALCFDLAVNEGYEGSRYHSELIAKYEIPKVGTEEYQVLPWQRPDKWTFQTQGVAVPALYYLDSSDQYKPLTNSANDYFEGLMVDEAQQKCIIEGNRLAFPSALAAAITNRTNDGVYLGCPMDTWKCQGISGEIASELIDGQECRYWKIKSELLYRESGWNLRLPDVGFNTISTTGVKQRAMVYDDKNNEWVASANPIALDGNGAPAGSGAPAILNRRIYKQCDFSNFFGTPPS